MKFCADIDISLGLCSTFFVFLAGRRFLRAMLQDGEALCGWRGEDIDRGWVCKELETQVRVAQIVRWLLRKCIMTLVESARVDGASITVHI